MNRANNPDAINPYTLIGAGSDEGSPARFVEPRERATDSIAEDLRRACSAP